MSQNSKKRLVTIGILILLLAGLTAGYYYFMPHRNVVGMQADTRIYVDDLVNEYLEDQNAANTKYLNEEGESTILAVTGIVASTNVDQSNQVVVLLKSNTAKAGVSCTFTAETNNQTENIHIGDSLTIKGVIRSGAGYDEDLALYEDVILEKCTVLKK